MFSIPQKALGGPRYRSASETFLENHDSILFAETWESMQLPELPPETPEEIVEVIESEFRKKSREILLFKNWYKRLLRRRPTNARRIKEQNVKDLFTGKCDALYTIKSCNISDSLHVVKEPEPPLLCSKPTLGSNSSTKESKANRVGDGGKGSLTENLIPDHSLARQSAENYPCLPDTMAAVLERSGLDGNDEEKLCFHLPLLVVMHKKSKVHRPNELRMHLVACVALLESLGITKFPVFGLSTDGSLGVVTCCEVGFAQVPMKGEKKKYSLKVSNKFSGLLCGRRALTTH